MKPQNRKYGRRVWNGIFAVFFPYWGYQATAILWQEDVSLALITGLLFLIATLEHLVGAIKREKGSIARDPSRDRDLVATAEMDPAAMRSDGQ